MKTRKTEPVDFRTLRWLLIVSFVVLATLPLAVISYKAERVGEDLIQEKVMAHLSGLAEKSANYLDSYLGERLYDLRIFSFLVLNPSGIDEDVASEAFHRMQVLSGAYLDLFFLDQNGRAFFASRPYDPGLAVLVASHLASLRHGREGCISSVSYYPSGGGTIPVVLAAVPLYDRTREERGIAVAVMDFRPIEKYVRSTHFERTGELYLVDGEGRFLTAPRLWTKPLPERIDLESITTKGEHRYKDYRGQRVLRARQGLERTGWFIIAEQDHGEALEQALSLRKWVYLLTVLFVGGILLIAWGVSERIVRGLERGYRHEKELEFQAIHKSKLAALGMLTSGLAHEVNTPLASALLYTQMLREELPGDQESAQQQLAIVEAEIKQCSRIVRNLLDVARLSPQEGRACDVNAELEKLLAIARTRIEEDQVRLRCRFNPDLPPVGIGESVMQEVFTNLIANALEAMPAGGVLSIDTHYVAPLDRVAIDITDTGTGIPAEHIGKLFEPFFTTKDGDGTGLGLYMSHEIVKRYGGAMRAISRTASPGQPGITIFTVELPVAKGEP